MATQESLDLAQTLYVAYYGRPADRAGLNYWADEIDANGVDAMVNAFGNSAEFEARFGNLSNEQLINNLYQQMFGRSAELAGLDFYSAQLANGESTLAEIALDIANGAQNEDATALSNKVAVAANFTAAIDTTEEVLAYAGDSAANSARDFLATVNAETDAETVDVDAQLSSLVQADQDETTAGETFTLTTGVDNFVGTNSNDIFNGLNGATAPAATDTLSAADIIDGGAGTDTLNITATAANTDVTGGAKISGIEVVNVRVAAAANADIDASNIAGATQVWADSGVGSLDITNLATGATVGVKSNGTVVNGAVTFAYKTASDAVSLALAGGTSATTTVTNSDAGSSVKTVNITSSGAANKIGALELDGDTVANEVTTLNVNATTGLTATLTTDDYVATGAALTVTGAGAVDLGANGTFKTIDASANTGGLTIALDTVTTSVKGSAGNDVITTAATTATTAGMVDGGEGTDTLVLATNVTTAAEAAEYVNFETIRLAAGGTQDMSLFGTATAVELQSGANAVTKLTATQAANVKALADITTGSFALADATGTSDVLSITLGTGKTTSEATDTGALTLNGFETLNLVANGGPDSLTAAEKVSTIASFTADKLTAINLTGQSFDLTNAATTKAVTIDGSALTGNLTIAGNLAKGSTVTGSAGKDALTLGTAGSTYNAGAGDDTINGTAAQINTAADYNVIDGGEGTDTLNITGGGALTLVDNNLSKITNVEKVVIATTTTNDQTITTGGFFDTNWKTNGIDLTTTTTTGDVAIDMTSFTGAAKLSVTTAGTTGGEGAINVQTGTGADDVTVSAAAAGDAGTVKTYAGNDKITTAGTEAFTLIGGAGDDTYVLGSTGVNTVEFSAVASNGVDTITGFTAGTDVLKVSTLATLVGSATGGIDVDDTANAAAKADTAVSEIAQISTDAAADWADVATIIAQSATVAADTTAGNATTLFAIDNGTDTRLYLFQDDATSNATIEASELTLVGTISGLADATSVDL